MRETTHTPGPWEVDTTKEHGRTVFQIGAREGDTAVTNVSGFQGCIHGSLRPLPQEEDAANAILIAAAPDMRAGLDEAEAGLEFAIAVIQERGGCNCSRLHGQGPAGFVCSPHKALASVRAAIAKAAPVSESPEVR